MQLQGRRVLVIGAARSGLSAAKLLLQQRASIILYDANTKLKLEDIQEHLDRYGQITLILGELPKGIEAGVELVIISPGVPIDSPIILPFRALDIPIWGEIELAYRFAKGRIVGITGTNGKTTTATLTGEILKAWYKEVFIVGNIGNPYTDIALKTTETSISVIELSSFQLETIHSFRPDVSALLNISPDHLDRHHTMKEYINAKENITHNQSSRDYCIINYEDEELNNLAGRIQAQALYFSSSRRIADGVFLDGDLIILAKDNKEQIICNVNNLKLLGIHNYENIMASILIAIVMGVPLDVIINTVTTFQGVEHRIEYVETINGVAYYNDSKGTNTDATIKAISAMKKPIILIAGGYDKGYEFDELIEAFSDKVKCLVLFGQTGRKIADTARNKGFQNIIMAENLKEAVSISAENAVQGDAVLLSPACASWDMFENYEQRGKLFKEHVRKRINNYPVTN